MIDVVCAIIWVGDDILVAQRSEHMLLPNKWEFPGGKLEPNESHLECIKRELREELNIEVELIRALNPHVHHYPLHCIRLWALEVRYIGGEIKLFEHSQFRLCKKNELVDLDLAEADINILNEFLDS